MKKKDWWEIMLYAGAFILAAVFIYQLSKIISAAGNKVANFPQQLAQAALETITTVEAGIASMLSGQFAWLKIIPTFVDLVIGMAATVMFGPLVGAIVAFISSAWSGFFGSPQTAAPIDIGNGTSYTGIPGGNSGNGNFSAYQ